MIIQSVLRSPCGAGIHSLAPFTIDQRDKDILLGQSPRKARSHQRIRDGLTVSLAERPLQQSTAILMLCRLLPDVTAQDSGSGLLRPRRMRRTSQSVSPALNSWKCLGGRPAGSIPCRGFRHVVREDWRDEACEPMAGKKGVIAKPPQPRFLARTYRVSSAPPRVSSGELRKSA